MSFLKFVTWKRTTTSKKSIEANINELVTTIIWETQIKWWSASINLGLVNICYYSIRITIEAYTNLKQILEKKSWEKMKCWKFENWISTKMSQTKMLRKQKGGTSPILHKFTLLNLINGKCFHIFAITSQNKSTSVALLSIA